MRTVIGRREDGKVRHLPEALLPSHAYPQLLFGEGDAAGRMRALRVFHLD
jgi:hypothetical protein